MGSELAKAVVFDMDGVLIDARDWHYEALNDALRIFDAEIDRVEHLSRFDGLPTKVKLRHLSEDGRLPLHLHPMVEAIKQERTLRETAKLCFPRIEHLLMMSWLKNRGIGIGVATNSIRDTAISMLTFAGLFDSIDILVTNEDVRMAKPAPDMYQLACEKLGLRPDEVLVVEDNEYGVRSAKSAGCNVIQVSGVADVTTSLLEEFISEAGAKHEPSN